MERLFRAGRLSIETVTAEPQQDPHPEGDEMTFDPASIAPAFFDRPSIAPRSALPSPFDPPSIAFIPLFTIPRYPPAPSSGQGRSAPRTGIATLGLLSLGPNTASRVVPGRENVLAMRISSGALRQGRARHQGPLETNGRRRGHRPRGRGTLKTKCAGRQP